MRSGGKQLAHAKGRQTKKAIQKLKNLRKKGKLKRHVINAYREINSRKYAESRQKATNIEKDWEHERQMQLANEEDDEILPVDMLDADIDWERSAFANKIARLQHEEDTDAEADDDLELTKRHFDGEPADDVHELLPIKVDGKLLKRSRKISERSSNQKEEDKIEDRTEENYKEEDYSNLSALQLLKKRGELIEAAKLEISGCAYALLAQPQQETHKLRTLLKMCKGEEVHSLVRESVQKLATASVVEIFVDIIPGYAIRSLSEDERSQKMKKETKKLQEFESTLLRYYSRFLQFLEKNVTKLLPKTNVTLEENTFTYTLAMLSLRSLSKLLISASHFNFSTNIISLLVRLTTSKYETVIEECCEALSELFAADVSLRNSAYGARAIAAIVNEKKCDISPKLLSTFLRMNIKEVDKGGRGKEKRNLLVKRIKLAKERQSKSKAKYTKQLKKLEEDLREVEAAESLSTKLKYATEAMKHIFVTYFRVIKNMRRSALLEPVLEGLSKFAHLLNVEFFDDIISALQSLIEQQHMRVLDSLYCVHAVFVILSGEGIAINVDPFRFYRSVYRLMTSVPFEKRPELRDREVSVMLSTLHMMINLRRKQVPLGRVAAFVKRLLIICCILPSHCVVAILAGIRTFFISHPRLSSMLENAEEVAASGLFKPDIDDPDCCNALSSTITSELSVLCKHPDPLVVQLAKHLRAGLPSSGAAHISAEILAVKPYEWIERYRKEEIDDELYFYERISLYCKKRKVQLSSKNMQMVLNDWLISML
uniref:NOC3-like protein n=1 Tax=Parascaris univalens TaxID=6257 RepID=A0A915B6G7_PARUN